MTARDPKRARPTMRSRRRWWEAPSHDHELPDDRSLQHALLAFGGDGRTCRLTSTHRRMAKRADAVAVDDALWALCDAGLVAIAERRDARGDWTAYQWRVTEDGVRLVAAATETEQSPDIAAFIEQVSTRLDGSTHHPAVPDALAWMRSTGASASVRSLRVVMAIVDAIATGERPTARGLSIAVTGRSKSLRIQDYRVVLEEATGLPLADLVTIHTSAVYVYGPLSFTVAGRRIHADWSVPWLALTEDVVENMADLKVSCERICSIENLTPFEHEVRSRRPSDAVMVYTGGNVGPLVRTVLHRLIEAGIQRVEHWGDLDAGGLRILRHLREVLPVPVEPWRMDPDDLQRCPTQPLTSGDVDRLQLLAEDGDSVIAELASHLLAAGRKLEQEAQLALM